MDCPACGSAKKIRSGFVNGGKQRYRCKNCQRYFTERMPRGRSLETKLKAIKLLKEGMSLRAVGRVLNVSNVSVLKWLRHFTDDLKEWYNQQRWKEYDRDIPVVEIDELWHYCKKNSSKSGFGLLLIDSGDGLSPLKWAIVPLKH